MSRATKAAVKVKPVTTKELVNAYNVLTKAGLAISGNAFTAVIVKLNS